MNKISGIPKSEWWFGGLREEYGACFVWESLRTLIPQEENGLERAIIEICSFAGDKDWFQRFCRREEFVPLKVLSWISSSKTWPREPWSKLSVSIREKILSAQLLPPLIELSRINELDTRYSVPIQRNLDLLLFALSSVTTGREVSRSPERIDGGVNTAFQLLNSSRAFVHPEFLINWQMYSREELVRAFEKWLRKNWPKKLLPYQSGGRVDPYAWLMLLGAHRVYQAANGDKDRLSRWKDVFFNHYPRDDTDKSLGWYAIKFHVLTAKWIPEGFLPEKPTLGRS